MPVADIEFTEYLNQETLDEIATTFNKVDVAGTGSLSDKELAVLFKQLGQQLNKKQLMEIINEVDFDGSGGIELDEFYVMVIKLRKLWPRPDLINYHDYMTDAKIRNVNRAFAECDKEGKGWIEEADFVDSVLETLKIHPKEGEDFVDAVLKQALPDGSNRMDFDTCCSCVAVLSKARKRINYREFMTAKDVEQYRKAFQSNDFNNDGSASVQEIDRILQRLGYVLKQKQLKSIVKDFDVNESGELDFEEFCVMMCRMCRPRRLRIISRETCNCRDLYRDDRFTVKELFLAGFTLGDLKKAGVSVREIRNEGSSALDFRRAGYTSAELRRAGVHLTELRGAGFSLSDLRVAGFSDGAVAEANRMLRSSISVGNLGFLPQCNPVVARTIYGTKDFCKSLPVTHPLRMMTPLIRQHTDFNVFPDPPQKKSLAFAGANMLGRATRPEALDEPRDDDNTQP
jgi:Ca2+-binding EF-hand superfamily protein/ribosomal protein L13E